MSTRRKPIALAIAVGLLSAAGLSSAQITPEGFTTLEIGDPAPGFTLPGIDGRDWSLSDFDDAKILMVLFTSNHCPTSHGIELRLQRLRDDFRNRSLALVAINPNNPMGMTPGELGYGKYTDSFEDMKAYAGDLGWDFPYIYDGEEQRVARAYGCLATPHVFIFDRNRELRYQGRFDDSRYHDPDTVKSPDARNALDALFAGEPVPVEVTKPHGCSTKWKEKRVLAVKAQKAWDSTPVTLETIDAAGVAALRANPTDKIRMFNIWATWCAPCVQEFPELVKMIRMYGGRDFELITISMDNPEHQPKVLQFLDTQRVGMTNRMRKSVEAEGRTTNNYLYTGASQDDLMAALDPEWPGPLPHSILVAPGGEIVLRQNGLIDPEAFRGGILDFLTPYWQPPANSSE